MENRVISSYKLEISIRVDTLLELQNLIFFFLIFVKTLKILRLFLGESINRFFNLKFKDFLFLFSGEFVVENFHHFFELVLFVIEVLLEHVPCNKFLTVISKF